MTENEIKVVNILATGDLRKELNLQELSEDLHDVSYSPENSPGIVYKPSIPGTLVVYRSGKYTVSGVCNRLELADIQEYMIDGLNNLGIRDISTHDPKVQNIVCTGDIKRSVDLSELSVFLGIEYTEYEPEQSPFLVYRPNTSDCVITIASSGKAVITGVEKREKAEQIFSQFSQKLDSSPV